MLIGAGSAALLGLAAPATAGDPIAQPAPVSPAAGNSSAGSAATPEEWDGAPSGATDRVVIMTLSKPRAEPEPKSASNPGELRKRALAKRPQRASN
jgi:hypothetical protein